MNWLMFDEADVEMWCKLLGQAAREKDPEKLAGILALIETAARAERAELQRRHVPHAQRNRYRQASVSPVESHPWSTLLASEDDRILLGSNPARNSEMYLRYLRLADSALTTGKGQAEHSSQQARRKRKAA